MLSLVLKIIKLGDTEDNLFGKKESLSQHTSITVLSNVPRRTSASVVAISVHTCSAIFTRVQFLTFVGIYRIKREPTKTFFYFVQLHLVKNKTLIAVINIVQRIGCNKIIYLNFRMFYVHLQKYKITVKKLR